LEQADSNTGLFQKQYSIFNLSIFDRVAHEQEDWFASG
jgi:hypothetical protein